MLHSRIPHSKKNFQVESIMIASPPPQSDSIYHLKFNRKISGCTVVRCHQTIKSNITSYSVFFLHKVVATCRTDAIPLLESFGADCVVDYTHPDAEKRIREEGK